MKKIYILGCFPNKGVSGDDSSNLDSYMELGWELMTTGFWAKSNLSELDYICTAKDRLFMYAHITKNLIAWEDLSNNNFDEYHKIYLQKFELLKTHSESAWTEETKNKITSNNFSEVEDINYVCIQIRRRDHCPWRSGPVTDWISLANKLSKKYKKVYVVGQGNTSSDFRNNVELVNLKEYCSLIKSKGCVMSLGVSSGCMALNYFYGRKNLPVYLLYTEDINVHKQNHLLFFGERTNLAGVDSKLYLNFESLEKAIIDKG